MNKKRLITYILIVVFILTTSTFSYLTYLKIKSDNDDVTTLKTIRTKPKILLSATGIQAPINSYTFYYNPSFGQLNRILVKNNDKVSIKKPIIEYCNFEKENRITNTKNALNHLSFNKSSTSHSQLNSYLLRSNLQFQMIQDQSSIKSTLVSPINGRISILNVYPSKANDKIVQIDSDERVIHANISESDVSLLKINQNISVTSSDHTQFIRKIKEITTIPNKIKNGISYYWEPTLKSLYYLMISRYLKQQSFNINMCLL